MQQTSKYLLISGVTLFLVGALLAMLGFLTIDVPVPETWLFFIGILLLIVAIALIVAGVVIRPGIPRSSATDGLTGLLMPSAFLGFLTGFGLWVLLNFAIHWIEGAPCYYGAVGFLFVGALTGLAWALIYFFAFPLMWSTLKAPAPSQDTLLGIAWVAFVVQGAVIVLFDLVITRLSLRPRIDAFVSGDLMTVIELAVGVGPALVSAYVAMRRAARRLNA